MQNEQSEFWSRVAQKYDAVVDLQIGSKTRSLVRDRVAQEEALGDLAEFGCGTGFFTQVLAVKSNSVVATDLSQGMLAIAKERLKAGNIKFQTEDSQKSSLSPGAFDTAFISLVIQFTEPASTLAEMHRILKPGGTLIVANLDLQSLRLFDRFRSLVRIIYRGLTGYRVKPPKGFGKNLLTEKRLCELLTKSGFRVASTETFRDPSHSSNIPIGYVRAIKVERKVAAAHRSVAA